MTIDFSDRLKSAVESIVELQSISAATVRSCLQNSGLSTAPSKALRKSLLSFGKECKANGRYGRLQASILIGVSVYGNEFLKHMERAKFLLAEMATAKKFHSFLKGFHSSLTSATNPDWQLLEGRLPTYITHCSLLLETGDNFRWLAKQSSLSPRTWATRLLAVAELCFLNAFYGIDVSEKHMECFASLDTPEDFAEAVSTVIALANEQRELDAWDFSIPTVGDLADDLLLKLIEVGHLINQIRDVEKHITLFQYSLSTNLGNGARIFTLVAPTPEFESTMRLGYIRSELGRQKIPLDLSQSETPFGLTLPGMAERFVGRFRKKIAEVRDQNTNYRRLRVQMPLDPNIQTMLNSFSYYEDRSELEFLSQDFAVPVKLKDSAELRLSKNLTVKDFMSAYRLLRFYAFVNLSLLRPYAKTDQTLFFNSLVRIASEEPLLDLLQEVAGLSREAGRDLLSLISARSNALGFYDLQYKPFFSFRRMHLPARSEPPREYAYSSFLLTMSNMTRNVRVANQLRFKDDGPILVMAVAAALRKHFSRVVTERVVKDGNLKTDVDVAVLEDNTLYLFECKHSLPSTGIHETRDLWEDIEHGLQQLSMAKTILQNSERLGDYLAGWFPGFRRKDLTLLKIVCCVLSSHRLFSGLEVEGTPVRDVASLHRLLDDGVVGMGQADGEDFLMHEFSFRQGEKMTAAELSQYLSPNSIFHKSFEPFLIPFTRISRIGKIVFGRDTFVHSSSIDEWIAHMEALGCRRLPDRTVKLHLPENMEELRKKIEGLSDEELGQLKL